MDLKYTTEVPSLAMMTIHMDNDSPRGKDALFQAEAFMAAKMGLDQNGVAISRRTFSLNRDAALYDVTIVIEKAKQAVEELYPNGGYSRIESVSDKCFTAFAYEPGSDGRFIEFYATVRMDYGSDKFFVNAYGATDMVDSFSESVTNSLTRHDVLSYDIQVVKAIDETGSAATNTLTIPHGKLDEPHIEFYPELQRLGYKSIEEFEEDYMKSNKPLLLLMGLKGAGKTVLSGWMSMRAQQKTRLLIQHDAPLMSAGFGAFLLGLQGDTLVSLEDSYNTILMSRERSNVQMSAILNFCDGVGSYNNKMMVTTNVDNLSQIDDALPRPGRLFRAIKFGLLTPDQANASREKIGLPAWEFTNEVSLAEALNAEDGDVTSGFVTHTRPGF